MSDGPTTLSCGGIPTDSSGEAVWSAAHSPYILPANDPNLPTNDPLHPNCLKPDPAHPGQFIGDDVYLAAGSRLTIDGSLGPVDIFSHGTGIVVAGGQVKTTGTGPGNTVRFDAEPDVASWDGIAITTGSQGGQQIRGSGSFDYTSIEHALTAISIDSGSSALTGADNKHYGLIVTNSGIGPSYFDGIDAINTPIQLTGKADGRYGTLNNIGSQGVKVTFDSTLPNYPGQPPDATLDIERVTFGSSVPFAETSCVPLQPCAAGAIGNDAVQGSFDPGLAGATVSFNRFFRAGSYGLELHGALAPTITDNVFVCNGSGSPKPVVSCAGLLPRRYSAIYLDAVRADILAPANVSAGYGIQNNLGQQNGLDALVLNGTVTSDLAWQTPVNDSNPPTTGLAPPLGYMVANGDLEIVNDKRLIVGDGDVVKVTGGAIKLNHATLDASSAGAKSFTSMRDNATGIGACPSVFVQSCPSPVPSNDWTGIALVAGSNATINKATISYTTTGIRDISGATRTLDPAYGAQFGLVVSQSLIGPSFADGVAVADTPVALLANTFGCPATTCASPLSAGNHGLIADFSQSGGALGGGLRVEGNRFNGTVNEAIYGVALAQQAVWVKNNIVSGSGASGIHLQGAVNPTLTGNTVTDSGTGTPTYPAVYLNGVSNADFNTNISGNVGSGNGLDAVAFHGTTATSLSWKTIMNSTSTGPLGYLVDGPLVVNGAMTLHPGDYVPTGGAITVTGGRLTADGAVVTSLKDSTVNIPTCGSYFDQKASSACPRPAPGDWSGFTLDARFPNALSGSEVRYGATAIAMGKPGVAAPLTLNGTNLRNLSADGIATKSSLDLTGGAFTNIGGRAVSVDLTGSGPASISIVNTSIAGTGGEGIFAAGLSSEAVRIDGVNVDHAGATGIDLVGPDSLSLTNNTVTNTAARYPAIYLNGFSGPFAGVSGNKGNLNGLDALVFHGTVKDNLAWTTARQTSTAKPLGYLLDGDLNLAGTLSVNAGDIVKSSGAFNVGHLKADDAGNPSQKIFTSLADDSIGVRACGSVLLPACTGAAPADWGGINLADDAAIVNAAIRYATTGVSIGSRASSTFGSSGYGLVVSRSRIESIKADGIDTWQTALSVTDSSIDGGVHGINADFTGAGNAAALRLSGNRFGGSTAEAVVGQALAGHALWITDNQVQNAGTFGLRLVGADQLVLRGNDVTGSGGGPGAGSARYPAIYLSHVTADFGRDVRGNLGSGNGLDAILMDGTALGGLNWITPSAAPQNHSLGYLLDGALTVQGGTMTVRNGDIVKGRGGPITIKGASLNANGATFTSLTDPVGPVSCPSAFVTFCGAAPGDWGGLVVTQDAAGKQSAADITGGGINYAETALSTDNGPITAATPAVTLSDVAVSNISKDGVNSVDTPIAITNGTSITSVGSHGVIASFFSPSNCPVGCERFRVSDTHITGSAKDAIVANGLGGQPTIITGDTITAAGTYGIRLVGADTLTARANTITGSGTSAPTYPAIYLSGVSGDFQSSITGNLGTGNGLDALVFHGVATGGLNWLTPGTLGSTLGYMLDGPLTVNGSFNTTGVVKVLSGAIKVNGVLNSTDTVFTSMKTDSVPSACGTVFVPAGCAGALGPGDYWGGISVDPAAPSSFSGGSITDATSGITMGTGELDMTGATITNISGYAIQVKGTGSARITCTGIHGNGGGIKSDGGTVSIDNSDLYGNAGTTGKDFDGTAPGTASRVWWNGPGAAGAPNATTQYNPVIVTPSAFLPRQAPTLQATGLSSVMFSSDNTNSVTASFGKGSLTVTLQFDRTMNLSRPLNVGFTSALDNVFHPVVGDWKGSDRITWVGHAAIDGTALTGRAGLNTLSVRNGASCMRDGTNVMDKETAPFNLDFSTAAVDHAGGATHIGAHSATVGGVVNPLGWSLPSANPASETYAFVESAPLGTSLPDPASVIAGVNPSTLLGYTVMGHGNSPQPVSQTITGLAAATAYHYAVAAVDLNGATLGPEQTFTTTAAATSLVLTGSPTITAGTQYSYTVTAKDGLGSGANTVADYTGTVHFTLQQADPSATLPSPYTFVAFSSSNPGTTSDDGTHSFTITLTKALNQTILAGDTVASISGNLALVVNPAAAKTLVVSGYPNPTTTGDAHTFTVTAKDGFGNTASAYAGTVDFTSSDSQAVLPAPASLNRGTGSFSLTLKTTGTQSITAKDQADGTIGGSQAGIQVNPPAPVVAGIAPSTGPAAGGTVVTISGSNLAAATEVKFGTVSGTITGNTATQVTVKSPTHSAGAFDITVTTAGGTSAISSVDQFTYSTYSATVRADAPSIFWRLGDSSGTTATDATAAGNNGTYSAGVTLAQAGALVGDSDKAVTLDGTTGSIQESSGAGAPTGSANRSLETWFKTTVAGLQPLFNYGAAGTRARFTVFVASNQVQVNDGTEVLAFTAVTSLNDGLWHHIVVTYDGTTAVTVYIDGAAAGVAQNTSGALATPAGSPFQVGTDSTTFFAGSLDEAAVYGVDLSSTRVAAHYHAGHGD